MKRADYCISKMSFDNSGKTITECLVHEDNDTSIGSGYIKNRNWLVQKVTAGNTFCCIEKGKDGRWKKISDFMYNNGCFSWSANLPKAITRRKTFVSYYHKDDQAYRQAFENLFGDLIVSKSVEKDDIDSDNSDEYIKQLIQKEYLYDTTVLVVLIGSKTKCRKHIDWEIAGALNYKVGDNYAGLLGILLPTHPDYGKENYSYSNLPTRLAKNIQSGYAVLIDWNEDRKKMQDCIELAFSNRSQSNKITNKAIPQMDRDICS
jgi:MTH538 TIR-like domain (DUF1863)